MTRSTTAPRTPTALPIVLLIAAVIALAGCGSNGGDDTHASGSSVAIDAGGDTTSALGTIAEPDVSDGSSTTSTTSSTAGSRVGSTTSSATTHSSVASTSTSAATGSGSEGLLLDAEGLRLVQASNGATSPLPFGTGRDVVVQAVSAALGPPDAIEQGTAECSNGQAEVVVWNEEIAIDFDAGGGFLSWMALPGSELTDMAGVGLGSTRGDLATAWVVDVDATSLGTEFATPEGGGLGGLLEGEGPDALITDLWGGTICAFR